MEKRLVYLFAIALTTCSTQKSFVGNYLSIGKDYEYRLQLSSDSTFTLIQKYFEVNSSCKGKWTFKDERNLILKCVEETEITNVLTSGYMSDRKKEVLILNYRKLKLGQVTLKREN